MEKRTGCECPLAGFCKKHNMNKTPHYHKLCQNHVGYFNQWEDCRGPGQDQMECIQNKNDQQQAKEPQKRPEPKLPSITQQAKNFAGSFWGHMKSGFAHATPEKQQERLDLCRSCEFHIPSTDKCARCGCHCPTKTSWASSRCPVGKW